MLRWFAVIVFLAFPALAFADVQCTSALYPGSCVNDATFGTSAVTNPGNARLEDGIVASLASLPQIIRCTDYAIVMPSTRAVVGYTLEVKKQSTSAYVDDRVQLYSGGIIGTNHADESTNWPDPLAWVTYGSSSDDWGVTLMGSDVTSSQFGTIFQGIRDDGGPQSGTVDAHRLTVCHDEVAQAPPVYQDYPPELFDDIF